MNHEEIEKMHKGYAKGTMKWVKVVALLSFSFAVIVVANTYSRTTDPSMFRSFSVQGEGEVSVVPDIAELTLSVLTEGGADAGILQEENSTKMNKIISYLKDAGVDEKDIKTSNYSISPRYKTYSCGRIYTSETTLVPCPPSEIVGYTIRQSVNVKVRDFSKIGEILKESVVSGANTVSGPSFTIDDMDAVRELARAEAIENAIEKAEAMADAGGFGVGKLLSINEGGYYPQYKYALGGATEDIAYASAAPAIEAGSQEITISVNMTYEIK